MKQRMWQREEKTLSIVDDAGVELILPRLTRQELQQVSDQVTQELEWGMEEVNLRGSEESPPSSEVRLLAERNSFQNLVHYLGGAER